MSRIDQKLSELLDSSEKPSIFKIHGQLRSENEEAYEPQVVSIGPYHHGKPKVKEMEEYKLRYFKELLRRRGESSAEKYIIALADLQDQARRCYAEEISLSKDDFVEMLCLDGCFVIEFLRKCRHPGSHWQNDPHFQMLWLGTTTANDLILFENQLPFFVLQNLFDMTKSPGEEENLIDLAIDLPLFFDLPDPGLNSHSTILEQHENENVVDDYQAIHLLGLVYKALTSGLAAKFIALGPRIGIPEDDPFSVYYMTSASELQEINGVKFEDSRKGSWLEITWENGVVKIPRFMVHFNTERQLRSLIAYEQHYVLHHWDSREYINDYAIFMGRLIHSARDVEVLRHSKIIINKLNDDQAVSTMFRRVTRDIYPGDDFCYAGVCSEVEKYAKSRRHIWWTKLRKTYFNTPWSPISFVAAVVALILTFLQTLYTIRSPPPR